jgi:hypothetical protein
VGLRRNLSGKDNSRTRTLREQSPFGRSSGFDDGGDVVVEIVGAAQCAADALDFELAGSELPGGLTNSGCAIERGLRGW